MYMYTDGACLKNPGPGGWATILVHDNGTERVLSGAVESTTNNRMELMAAIEGLKASIGAVVIVSDSKYLVDGASKWLANWKKRGWRTTMKGKGPVKNQDLWQELDALMDGRQVYWRWVRGHSGHKYNERCDALANGHAGLRGW